MEPILVDNTKIQPIVRYSIHFLQIKPRHLFIGELALALHEVLSLLGVGVEKARLHLRLFVLERHVARQNVAAGEQGGSIG